MLEYVFLATLVISANAFVAPNSDSASINIIGGTKVNIEQYPYQLAIIHDNDLWCGGSILTENKFLTAKHCMVEATKPLTIHAGSSFWQKPGSVHTVKNYVMYGSDRFTDIAVVTVNEPFLFDKTRKPVQIIGPGEETKAGSLAIVTGWGDTESLQLSDQLLGVNVPVVDKNVCNDAYVNSTLGPIVDGELCAGGLGQDSCSGDSGSPLTYHGKQIGIVSMGDGCGLPDRVGIYADVAYFSKWISDHMAD